MCHFCNTRLELKRPYPSDPGKGKARAFDGGTTSSNNIAVGTHERFFCTQCQCWNSKLDGELVQEQAAYDASLNEQSFSLRGKRALALAEHATRQLM